MLLYIIYIIIIIININNNNNNRMRVRSKRIITHGSTTGICLYAWTHELTVDELFQGRFSSDFLVIINSGYFSY